MKVSGAAYAARSDPRRSSHKCEFLLELIDKPTNHNMHDSHSIEELQRVSRRHFFGTSAAGLGSVALGTLLGEGLGRTAKAATADIGAPSRLQFPPRVK